MSKTFKDVCKLLADYDLEPEPKAVIDIKLIENEHIQKLHDLINDYQDPHYRKEHKIELPDIVDHAIFADIVVGYGVRMEINDPEGAYLLLSTLKHQIQAIGRQDRTIFPHQRHLEPK